jgi:hypothetical protein
MLGNSSELFVRQCANREFMDTLEDVLNSQRTAPIVRECLLGVLAAAAHAKSGTPYTPIFYTLWRKAETERDTDSTLYAMHLQREFEEEDRALSTQRTELIKSGQGWFECGICMDEMRTDSIAIIDSCGHTFCRECLRGHVTVRLDEHRFPILCPTCTACKGKGKGKTGGTCVYSRVGSCSGYSRDFQRGSPVSGPKPRTHRRAVQNLD